MSVRIRSGTPDDMPKLTEVFERASLSNSGDREALLAHPEVFVLGQDGVAQGRTRVAVQDDVIVGFATTLPIDGALELEDLFVDPEWMRQGVGRRLVLDASAIARTRGVERIVVTANPDALEFYGALGFVQDGEVQTSFRPAPHMYLAVAREP